VSRSEQPLARVPGLPIACLHRPAATKSRGATLSLERCASVHVTEAACEALSKLLSRSSGPERCLRLGTNQGNYRFTVDERIEHDIAFSYEERTVLVVSETVARDLWGITIDCRMEGAKSKIIFRKAKAGEPLEAVRDDAEIVPPQWRADQHERLLEEIAEISRQIASVRRGSKTMRDQLHVLEAAKQEKWDAIRTLWAGDGGWHKAQQNGGLPANGALPHANGATPHANGAAPHAATSARARKPA
jgi:Fe-S cluster assembly iron-binding protein IscA